MERNEDTTKTEDERFKEKIVYKIIPVPYYYPVPVEPEWYNKNYERQFRPNEFSSFPFVDTSVEHFVPPPPPGFPFPRFRHPHPHHVIYEPATKRVVSPPSPSTQSSPAKSQIENGRDEDTLKRDHNSSSPLDGIVPVSAAAIEKTDISDDDRNKDLKTSPRCEQIIIKTEIEDNETVIVNGAESPKSIGEENEVENIRDRKRYLMTFPYDQKKKIKVNGHSDGHESPKHVVCSKADTREKTPEIIDTLPRTEVHEPHFAAFPPGVGGIRYPAVPGNHQPPPGLPPGVPYVMVPVQNPAFMHPKLIHQPHFPAELRHPSLEEAKLVTDNHDSKLDFDMKDRDSKAESPGEVKYHPNGRRARTVFSRQQLLTLNNVFEKHHFVSGERMSELSDQLGLDRKIVKIWFQNKRQYSRKKGSLLEREEDYFEYQDSFNSGGAPPTMTMVNVNRIDDIAYKLSDENVTYKINQDYMSEKDTDYNKLKEGKLTEQV